MYAKKKIYNVILFCIQALCMSYIFDSDECLVKSLDVLNYSYISVKPNRPDRIKIQVSEVTLI